MRPCTWTVAADPHCSASAGHDVDRLLDGVGVIGNPIALGAETRILYVDDKLVRRGRLA
jgi:hypothetical protein